MKSKSLRTIQNKAKIESGENASLKNIELAGRLEKLGYRSFERVYQCAEVLKFIEQQDGTKKLYQSYFVKINFVQYVTGDGQ